MPRKKKSAAPAPGSVVPEYVQQNKLLQKRNVTKRTLPTFTEAMLLLHAPELLRKYFEALLAGLNSGDKAALEQVGEIFNFVRGKGINVNLTQQMLNQTAAASPESPVIGYDAFTRRLAEQRAALPAPTNVITVPTQDVTVVSGS